MTLNDCLVYAREHAYSNRLAAQDIKVASADRRIALAEMLPYIGLGSSGSMSFGRNIDPETNTYDNKQTLGIGFGIEMSVPLFDGLVRINNVKALKIAELRKKKKELIEEDKISLEVIKNFYNVAYCREMVNCMFRQLQRDSTDLVATEKSESLGIKSGNEVAEMKAVVATDIYELTNQQNLLKKAYLSLRSSMGMEISEDSIYLIYTNLAFSRNGAKRVLPEIEDAELAIKESQSYLRAAKGNYSPRLSINAGMSTSYYRMFGMGIEASSFSRQFRDNMGEYFGFSLSLPLFDGLSSANRVKRAKANLQKSIIDLQQVQYQMRQATEEARLDQIAAGKELSAAIKRMEAEKTAYQAVRRRYELGASSALDLYTSGVKLATAEANLLGKRIQCIISEIIMRYYLGYPLIENE